MSDLQKAFGWKLGPIQFPSGLHISVTHLHSRPGIAEQLLSVRISFNDYCRSQLFRTLKHASKNSPQRALAPSRRALPSTDSRRPFPIGQLSVRSRRHLLRRFWTRTKGTKMKNRQRWNLDRRVNKTTVGSVTNSFSYHKKLISLSSLKN